MYDKIFLQGGGKLLVILSWKENAHVNQLTNNCDKNGQQEDPRLQSGSILYSHYEVLFNGVGVPTTEVQPGVLRCLIPGKEIYFCMEHFIFKHKI